MCSVALFPPRWMIIGGLDPPSWVESARLATPPMLSNNKIERTNALTKCRPVITSPCVTYATQLHHR